MLSKKQVEDAMGKTKDNQQAANLCKVALRTFERYKTKYGLTTLTESPPKDLRGLVLERVKKSILSIDDFSREHGVSSTEVYTILHSLEGEGRAIEKSLSGYYINPSPKPQDLIFPYYAKRIKFGVVSDSHLGSCEQQITHLNTMYDIFEREGCKLVMHPGDLVDGESVFRGQRYGVFIVGADNQMQYAIDKYPKRKGIQTLMVSGNHDLDYHKSTGMDIVRAVAEQRKDIKYCGQLGAYVEFGKNARAYLFHPDGGGSYSISYKPQKLVAGMSPEKKPNLILIGHYHQLGYFKMSGVHIFLCGCFQGQTDFLRRKGLEPQIGGWILELNIGDDGTINRIKQECITFPNSIYKDY